MTHALDRGWHVGSIGSEDHYGTSSGDPETLPKTVIVARELTRPALRQAMAERRFYAVARGSDDLRIDFGADGAPMGSRRRSNARPTPRHRWNRTCP